jgi:Domain of unknown function (DUF5134)
MMIESVTARWLLTAVFAVAALGTVIQWRSAARQARQPDPPAAAFCLVMCTALIAMSWWLEPSAITWVQVAGFGCAALWFGLASGGSLGQFRRPRLVSLHHALMGAAMIWMLIALPGVVGMRPAGSGPGTMTAMSSGGPSVPVLAVSGLVAAGCAAAALPWLARAIGPGLRVTDPGAAGQAVMSAGMAAMLIVML